MASPTNVAKPRQASVDPRVERSRATILQAAIEIISTESFAACTVDAMVKRTGMAKATVYRHWPSRDLLVKDAIDRLSDMGPAPDTGSLAGDLSTFVKARRAVLLVQRLQTLTGLFEAVRREPEFAMLSARFLDRFTDILQAILQQAKARGELPADAEVDVMADMVLGALIVRQGFNHRRADDVYIRRLTKALAKG